jgi:hypothetical protein
MSDEAFWTMAIIAVGIVFGLFVASLDSECDERGGALVRDAWGGYQCVEKRP